MNSLGIGIVHGYLSGAKDRLPARKGIRVFCYHGVVQTKKDPLLERNFQLLSQFRSQVRFLRQFRVLRLDELVDELTRPTISKRPAVVITFDDGFANTIQAAEILNENRLPWALFVSTGVVGKKRIHWIEELTLSLLHGQGMQIELFGQTWSLISRVNRELAYQAILLKMKALSAGQRKDVLREFRRQFPFDETKRLLEMFPSLHRLTWDEIGAMASSGVEIGSHGIQHEIHHEKQSEKTLRQELILSKQELEERLGRLCLYFAFPNGNFLPTSSVEIQRAGYRMAFTMQSKTITSNTDPHLVPRLYAHGSLRSFIRSFYWMQKR
jgi:peptidoglycan/xylan/chitin deacetylase (PgdA/CDA1 family)